MKYGDLEPCNIALRDKLVYEGFMQMNKDYTSPF